MKLIGHSGCDLQLVGSSIVRKISPNPDYNKRLIKQAHKQNDFTHPTVKTPKIINIGYKNNLAYFDMEYITGVTLAKFCQVSNIKNIENIINSLTGTNDFKSDIKKQVKNKCLTLDHFPHIIIDEVDWTVPTGNCHGDLTFENILIDSEGQPYVLDFLDSYVNSIEVDCSKLMQDSFCGWSFRSLNTVPWHVLRYINDMLCSKRRYILLLINLYRIIPYTTNRNTHKWLQCQIKKTLKAIDH